VGLKCRQIVSGGLLSSRKKGRTVFPEDGMRDNYIYGSNRLNIRWFFLLGMTRYPHKVPGLVLGLSVQVAQVSPRKVST